MLNQIIISIKISNYRILLMKNTEILQQYPHLKSQWKQMAVSQEQSYFKHIYSADESEINYLRSVPMKQIDMYSSRQTYSFPYCPRIYKYMIKDQCQNGNNLCFELVVLSERVTSRLCANFIHNATDQQIKLFKNKAVQIVQGFDYLYRRFGAFEITPKMIGWTRLGIVKVWFNEDFASNKKEYSDSNQQMMVKTLIEILSENGMLKCKPLNRCDTFQSLIRCLQNPQEQVQNQTAKQLIFRPFQNMNGHGHLKQCSRQSTYSSKTKKNITFSYSNKNVSTNPICDSRLNSTRKSSILMNYQEDYVCFNEPAVKNIVNQRIERRLPSTSLKLAKKTASNFVETNEQTQNKFNQNNVHAQRNEEKYSNATIGYRNQTVLRQKNKVRPETLHYSTSINPLSKFIDVSTEGKVFITNGNANNGASAKNKRLSCEINLSQSTENDDSIFMTQEKLKIEAPKAQKQTGKQNNIKQCSELQRDLDALFQPDNKLDFKQLQNELYSIF